MRGDLIESIGEKDIYFKVGTRPLCATETVIFWSLCVTFISIRYEHGWSDGPQTGSGVGMGSISGKVRTD